MSKYDVLVNGVIVKTFKSYENAQQYLINTYGYNYNMYDCGIVKHY